MDAPGTDYPCYLDGRWLPLSEARVPVLDRGFLFGDAVYEVIPVYSLRLFRFTDHMARLARSLAAVRIPNPHTPDAWLDLMEELVRRHAEAEGGDDQLLYLQISRGVAPRQLAMPEGLAPTVFMMCQTLDPDLAEQRREGIACVSARDFRWERCDIKTTSLMGHVLARQIAVDRGATETILLREWPGVAGLHVTEGASSNVWIVLEGALIGVPPSGHTLQGLRIELLQTLAEEIGIPCSLRPIAEDELMRADEIMISSAGREVTPVVQLDGEPVGHGSTRGRPGPVYARLHEAYQIAKQAPPL
jgi:D-alanine transaminase